MVLSRGKRSLVPRLHLKTNQPRSICGAFFVISVDVISALIVRRLNFSQVTRMVQSEQDTYDSYWLDSDETDYLPVRPLSRENAKSKFARPLLQILRPLNSQKPPSNVRSGYGRK